MITHDPGITRLLDRPENRGLISRCRETKGRRTVRPESRLAVEDCSSDSTNRHRPLIPSNWATSGGGVCGP
jgi:hypothetical protein